MALDRILIIATVLTLTGCSTAGPSESMTADQLHQHCAARMYAARVGTGRSTPNWSLYDYCMKSGRVLAIPPKVSTPSSEELASPRSIRLM
jgi:hypothetical protein